MIDNNKIQLTTIIKKHMKNLKRLAVILLIPGFVAGFNSCKGDDKEASAETIRQQISENNEKINELTREISELERKLEQMGETSNNRSRTPVTISEVEYTEFNHYVNINGSVEAVKVATITPEISGNIIGFEVDKGDRVRKGQVVARLNSEVTRNNINEIKTSLELAETMYKRQKSLWEQEVGTEVQYLQAKNNYESTKSRLETLKSQLDMSVIRAPFDGIVENIFQKQGELATPGVPMMQILNLSELYINADVSERFLPVVNKNEEVILRFPSYPDFEERHKLHRVSNYINPENRTFRVQLKINNPDEMFKPNMTTIIGLRTFSTEEALVVPSFLIKQDLQGQFIYLAKEENGDYIAHKTYVKRGFDGEGRTLIESGIKKGDKVIVNGHNQVSDGALIQIRN